jgi:hypothetical protein
MTSEASLQVHLKGVGPAHPSAQAAAAELRADLRTAPQLRARERHEGIAGKKGAAVHLVVTLGASGSVGTVVKIVQLWLNRDRRRSLTVSVRSGNKETIIRVDGDPISANTLNEALHSVASLDVDAEGE